MWKKLENNLEGFCAYLSVNGCMSDLIRSTEENINVNHFLPNASSYF